jgi:large subunit ribosomal protein L9
VKVLLRQDVQGLGRRGDVVSVTGGYARNFLLPSGKALEATDAMARQAGDMQRSRSAKDAKDRVSAQAQAQVLNGAVIGIQARAGGTGKLFGSVGPTEIVAAIADQKGIEVDHHKIKMDEHIKELGSNPVTIELFDEVSVELVVEVIAQS